MEHATTLCPAIASSEDNTIKLSTYDRNVNTVVFIGCRGFGRHVRDPTNVTCLADGTWSATPTLECDVKLDYKERVYLAVILVSVFLLLAVCCWITAAILCCRRRGKRYGYRNVTISKWFRDRWGGQRGTDDRIVRYADVKERKRKWDMFYKKDRKHDTPVDPDDDDLEDNWFNKHTNKQKKRPKDDNSDSDTSRRKNRRELFTTGGSRMMTVHDNSKYRKTSLGRTRSLENIAHSRSRDHMQSARMSGTGNHGYSTPPYDFYRYMRSYEGYTEDPEARENKIAPRYFDVLSTTSAEEARSHKNDNSSRHHRSHKDDNSSRYHRSRGHRSRGTMSVYGDRSSVSGMERMEVTSLQSGHSRQSGSRGGSLLDTLYTRYVDSRL